MKLWMHTYAGSGRFSDPKEVADGRVKQVPLLSGLNI